MRKLPFALIVLAGLAWTGCATSFVANQPRHMMLSSTYDASTVRDAIATVVNRRRLAAQEGEGVIQVQASDGKLSCTHDVTYSGHSVDIYSVGVVETEAQAAQNLIDERCLDGAARLGKWIVKQVELPARLAAKEERRQRRAEAASLALGVIGAGVQLAGSVAGSFPHGGGGGSAPSRTTRTVNAHSNLTVTHNGATTQTTRQYNSTRVEVGQ